MDSRTDRAVLRALAQVAPGTPLRDGLDRVLQSGRGGLIVIGDGPDVLNICSGGFLLDAAFTPQRLSELAKMDGAIILAGDASRIARANVHLVPNPNVPTSETGTRHRTAERVARSLNVPVIAVSESRKQIQIYANDQRHPLQPVSRLLERTNQALQTLERYRTRLGLVTRRLTVLELHGMVTLRDVTEVLQRSEMVIRIAAEVERNLVELGSDGRLVRFQLEELMAGVADDRRLLIRDYSADESGFSIDAAMQVLAELDDQALFDDAVLAKSLRLAEAAADPEEHLEPRGLRLLSRLARVSVETADLVVEKFGSLRAVLEASPDDLAAVGGIGVARAQPIVAGLARLENEFRADLDDRTTI